ncbi:MAG: Undecaprenyl-diphosphatase [candidate division WWE3 bacterium GW2011_GWB1_47_11]|uniref:Undecaprenyl-diphosphatase n=2 Tax=Katanobacteria TaxID=422282 RepID=A0A0G1UHT5_UNCKA|nr:MAG: Undecaprenyl-diphosphatase [candidate division WWE3 bacterium GW2011_GWB1_47_11]
MFDAHAIVLGIVQGLTEFLPVSSSGHLIIFPHLFGWEQQQLVLDTTFHLGTAAALVVYFWGDLFVVFSSLFRDVIGKKAKVSAYSDYGRLGVYILIGSFPAGLIGLMLDSFIESKLRSVLVVAVFLILGSVLMIIAERFAKYSAAVLTAKKSLVIGLFQALALFPGISRSGATISAGMLSGLSREESARFSFLLSVPIVVAAASFKIADSFLQLQHLQGSTLFWGFVSSFVIGWLSIKFLMAFLKKHSLYWFVAYRLVLAVGLLLLF